MARRGRKRDPSAKRRATTRAARSSRDEGTPELRAKRLEAVGFDPETGKYSAGLLKLYGGRVQAMDASLSVSALTILYAHGVISAREMEAGDKYLALRNGQGLPSPHARVSQFERGAQGRSLALPQDIEDQKDSRRRVKFQEADAALSASGPMAHSAVWDVLVADRVPQWFFGARRLGKTEFEERGKRLQRGLDGLAAHFRIPAAGTARRRPRSPTSPPLREKVPGASV